MSEPPPVKVKSGDWGTTDATFARDIEAGEILVDLRTVSSSHDIEELCILGEHLALQYTADSCLQINTKYDNRRLIVMKDVMRNDPIISSGVDGIELEKDTHFILAASKKMM